MRAIRVWDANREQRVQDIPVGGSDLCVNALSNTFDAQNLCAAGCSDGTVRVFDRRLPTNECRVMTLRELHHPIVAVHLQQSCNKATPYLVAASRTGEIRLWEPRMYQDATLAVNLQIDEGHYLSAFDVHQKADLFVCGTTQPLIYVLNHSGRIINMIKNPEGIATLPHKSFGEIKAVKCHPYRVSLAAASADGFTSCYGVNLNR